MAQVEVAVVPLDYTTPDFRASPDIVKTKNCELIKQKVIHINNHPPSHL